MTTPGSKLYVYEKTQLERGGGSFESHTISESDPVARMPKRRMVLGSGDEKVEVVEGVAEMMPRFI